MSSASDTTFMGSILADPRLERLLTIGKEMNDLLAKIGAATSYIAQSSESEDAEEVEIARNQLTRDLSKNFAEAKALLPSLDDVVMKLQDQERSLENNRKMNAGLAKIESLTGSAKKQQFSEAAASSKARQSELENLIHAIDALQADLSTPRRSPHSCPRCSSAKISYRITPSELGYTLYKCDDCGNAWRITQFTISVA